MTKTKSLLGKASKAALKQKAGAGGIVLFLFSAIFNEYFLSAYNIGELFLSVSVYWVLCVGLTFVIVSGNCDLSLGGTLCMGGIIAIRVQNVAPLWVSLLAVIALGVIIGLLHGWLIVYQRTVAMICTLGTGILYKGINLIITNGAPISGTSKLFREIGNGKFLGVYYMVYFSVLVVIVGYLIMTRTSFGRNCYAVGGDKDVAVYSGINAKRHLLFTFIICSTLCAIGGFMYSARLNTGSATYGDTTALILNCGCVVGGTSFAGGVGGILQSVVGIFLFSLLENSMNLFGIQPYPQMLIKGILIVIIVCLDCLAAKRRLEDV